MKKKKPNELLEIEVDMLVPHPLNREFQTSGLGWDEFVESVRRPGRVECPLVVRDYGDGTFGILAGHRRHAAAVACELPTVQCLVRDFSDEQALCFLVNENMQRLELTPVDEARLMQGMARELEMADEEIAKRVSRSVGWVRTRQLMLDLGEELLEAVRDPHPDRHVCISTVEEILKVPGPWRPDAVQLVLHPDFEVRPLGPDQARVVLQKCLVEPRREEEAWEKSAKELAKEWKKRLAAVASGGADSLLVLVIPWAERESASRGGVPAEDVIPLAEVTDEAPSGLTWMDLAVRHGLAVKVVPGDRPEESKALVDARILRLGEDARREHGEVAWLTGKVTAVKDARTAAAKAVLDGEGEPKFDVDGPGEKVIEQGMEHHAFIDMGAVRKVAIWAVSSDADPMNAPDYVPKWACLLGVEGMWNALDEVCNWIVGLKKKI